MNLLPLVWALPHTFSCPFYKFFLHFYFKILFYFLVLSPSGLSINMVRLMGFIYLFIFGVFGLMVVGFGKLVSLSVSE